jgi:hypothetical protein
VEVHRLAARLRVQPLRRTCALDAWSGRRQPRGCAVGSASRTRRVGCCSTGVPAAEPFFEPPANPMASPVYCRQRWIRGRVSDYWDEVFTPDGLKRTLRSTTSPPSSPARAQPSTRMRDVPGTIAADQDAIIRAGLRGARRRRRSGTGKTVVAAPLRLPPVPDPRLGHRRGACCSSVRTSLAWPMSPTCSRALERRRQTRTPDPSPRSHSGDGTDPAAARRSRPRTW